MLGNLRRMSPEPSTPSLWTCTAQAIAATQWLAATVADDGQLYFPPMWKAEPDRLPTWRRVSKPIYVTSQLSDDAINGAYRRPFSQDAGADTWTSAQAEMLVGEFDPYSKERKVGMWVGSAWYSISSRAPHLDSSAVEAIFAWAASGISPEWALRYIQAGVRTVEEARVLEAALRDRGDEVCIVETLDLMRALRH